MPPIITAENVSFTYPDGTRALTELTLAVSRDERVVLFGPNGSGKSSLLQLLLGFMVPDEGRISLFGHPLDVSHLASMRERVGLVFQNPDDQLFCPTLLEDVAFGPRNLGIKGQSLSGVVRETLEMVDLWEKRDKEPYRLSWGEKKRAALATILAMKPEVILFDEPSAHLDATSKGQLISLLREFRGTLILVTQDLYVATSLCQRALVLNNGRLVHDSPMDDLLHNSDTLSSLGIPFFEMCSLCTTYGWHKWEGTAEAASGRNPPAGGSEARGQRSEVSRTALSLTSSSPNSLAEQEYCSPTSGSSHIIYTKNVDISHQDSHAD